MGREEHSQGTSGAGFCSFMTSKMVADAFETKRLVSAEKVARVWNGTSVSCTACVLVPRESRLEQPSLQGAWTEQILRM